MIQIAPATPRSTPAPVAEIPATAPDFAPVAPAEIAAETREAAPVLTALRAVDAANDDPAPPAETATPTETPALRIMAVAGRIFAHGPLAVAANDVAGAFYAATAPIPKAA